METLLRDVTQSSELFSIEDLSFVKMISSLSANLEEILTRTVASFLLHCKFPSLHQYDKLDKLQESYKMEVFKFPFRAWVETDGFLKITSAPARKKELWELRLISPAAASRFSIMMDIKIHPKNLDSMRDLNKIMKPEFPKLLV